MGAFVKCDILSHSLGERASRQKFGDLNHTALWVACECFTVLRQLPPCFTCRFLQNDGSDLSIMYITTFVGFIHNANQYVVQCRSLSSELSFQSEACNFY